MHINGYEQFSLTVFQYFSVKNFDMIGAHEVSRHWATFLLPDL
jgi:hypothetical protein